MLPSVDDLNCRHRGETIFVLGTSDSLRGMDLTRLEGSVVIGVNDAVRFFTPTYLLTVDFNATERALPHLMGKPEVTLLTRARIAAHVQEQGLQNQIHVLEVKPKQDMYFRGPLKQVDNTSHYAVEMAMRMRGTGVPGQIVLLGVDLRWPNEEEKTRGVQSHIFGDGATEGCKENFTKVIGAYPRTFEWLKRRKIDLITCSPWDGPLTKTLLRKTFGDLCDELRR